jgi:hypothetical protein
VNIRARGKLSRIDAGLGQPALQIIEMGELGLGRATPEQPPAVLDRRGEAVQVAVVVGERDHAEPQTPVAPHRAVSR